MAIDIDQFMTDFNNAKAEQGDVFDGASFGRDYNRGASRDRTQPEDDDSLNRKGFIRETTEALAGGAVDTAELWMRAVRAIDPQGGNETIRNFATFGLDSIKNFIAKHPSLSPDNQAQEGVARWWQQGVRSLMPSMSAAIPGIIGGAAGGPIGATIGGGAMSGAIFGLAEFDKFNEEVEERIVELGLSEDEAIAMRAEARSPAIYSALTEGGLEAAANALQVRTLGKFLPGRKTLKNLIKRPIKDIYKKTAKEAVRTGAKQLALTTPVEVGTEFAQSALETKFRRDIGLTDMDSWGAGIDALGPAFVTNLLFFGAGKSANAAQRWGIRHSLEDAKTNPHKRMKAVKDITNIVRGMDDVNAEGIANKMEAVGMSYVSSGMGIDINNDLGMNTMLEQYREGLQDKSITNIASKRMQDTLQKEMDREDLPLQQRIPSFQMFQGITQINEEQDAIEKMRKEEDKETVKVKATEADKLDQLAAKTIDKEAVVKDTIKKPKEEKTLGRQAVKAKKKPKVTEKAQKDLVDVATDAVIPDATKKKKLKVEREKAKVAVSEKELIPEGEKDVTGISEEDDIPTEPTIDRGEEFAQEEAVVSKKETPKPEVISQEKEVAKAVEKKLEKEAPKRKGEVVPISRKDELQVRKELKDPDITKGEKKDLEQILVDADLPIVVEPKAKKAKVEKAVELPTFEQTKKGLGDIETEIRSASTRFIHAAVKPKEKAELGVRLKALKVQEDIVRDKLGLDPKNVVEAKKSIKEKLGLTGRIGMGVDPTVIKDLGVVGGHHFKKGSRTFAEWAKKMIADFGEGVRSVLKKVFRIVEDDASKSVKTEPVSAKAEFDKEGGKTQQFEDKDFTDTPHVDRFTQEIFNKKLGPKVKGEALKERWGRWTSNWKLKIQQGAIDQYASLKKLDDKIWKLAQITTSSSGVVEGLLTMGGIKLTDGVPDLIDVKGGKGLFDSLKPLGEELELWLGHIAGLRAKKLFAEGKETNLTEPEIKKLTELNQGKMKDGRSRRSVYRGVWKDFSKLHQSVLDVAVETGTIGKEERETWRDGYYLPFFRHIDDKLKNETKGPKTLGGIANQTAFKELKGKDIPVADMLTNIILNWNHLVGASMKNQVAVKSLHQAVKQTIKGGDPVATRINVGIDVVEDESGQFKVIDTLSGKNRGAFDTFEEAQEHQEELTRIIEERLAQKSSNTVFVRENGKKVWYEVNEPNVYQALTNLNFEGFNNRPMKAMRSFKRALTFGVTSSPDFKIRNLFRDTISSAATSKISLNMFDNVFGTGLKSQLKNSEARMRMLVGGGEIMFGHLYGTDPEKLQHQLKKNLRKEGILDNPTAMGKFKAKAGRALDAWNDLGSKMENLNRGALFSQTLEKEGFLEANFNARDLLDFNRHGAWPATRFLIDVVPFMNARIQGLDKLGRSMNKDQGRRLAVVLGGVAMASMALYLAFKDDDEFKEREEWDRDTYWWFKLPGSEKSYRLPKPFEIGVIGTMAERLLEQFVDDEVHGKLFAERLKFALTETFSLGVTPQAVKPVMELMANKNFFTDRPIETLAMENLSPTERRKAWTSETAILMSQGFNKIPWERVHLSPVQVEHLVQGYLGWMGATTLGAIDQIFTQPLGGFPGRPSRRIEEYPLIGSFVRTTPSRATKYSSLFYEGLKEMNQTYADIRNYRTLGETEKAINLARKNKDKLRFRKLANKIQKNVANVTKRIRLTRLAKNLSAQEKRVKIDRLTVIKNKLLKMAVKRIDL